MSSVERALKKLRASMAEQSAARKEPVARVELPDGAGAQRRERPVARKSIVFDLDALTKAGMLSAANAALAEQYREVKQPILRNVGQETSPARANLVMVASALANEGKTFTCVNLSLSLAMEKDWEVLLIDCDCKNPQLGQLLGVQNEPGLLDLLKDTALGIESLILSTNVEGLSILPLGGIDAQAAELLASDRMRDVCDQLATDVTGRIAVFDSSPLLLTTESTILSHQVGQIVVVVQAGRTPQAAVTEAVAKLDASKPIGLVLNRVSPRAKASSYGGYGFYGPSADG